MLKPHAFQRVLQSDRTVLALENDGVLSSGLLYAPRPGSATMERCVSALASKGEAEFMGQVNMVTGPELVAKHASPADLRLPWRLLYPYTPWTGRGGRDRCLSDRPREGFEAVDGARWFVRPTEGCASEYPGAWAVDHFDNGGASWTRETPGA